MNNSLSVVRAVAVGAITLLAAVSSADAETGSAEALFQSGDLPAAATAYAAVLQKSPSDWSAALRLGAIRLYENDLAAAEPLLRSVLAADPGNARATRMLTELQRRRAEAARRTLVTGDASIVPFLTSAPLPVVRVVANGVPAEFIIDTGGDVDLEPSFAARLGVATQSAGNGVFAGGRQAALESGMLKSLALGSATAYDVPVHVFPTHGGELFPDRKIDGIVGTTYFERFLATLDFPNGRLILRPRSPQNSAVFEASAAQAGAAIVPCYLVSDHFVFARAQVNDAPPGLFLFDTGLAGGGLMPSQQLIDAAKISLDQAHAGQGIGGGGAVTAVPFVARRIAVGSAQQVNVNGLYTPQGSAFDLFPFTVWGIISNYFLRNYAYTVDFDAMKIVLAPPQNAAIARPPAQTIFDAAFRRLQAYPVPPYAVFTDTWKIRERPMGYYTGESSSVGVHRYAVRLADGMENVSNPIPSGKLPPAMILPEFLGPFAWTMRSSVRVAPERDPGAPSMVPDIEGLKTIATVVAVEQGPYAVDRADSIPIEDVDGHRVYHLKLRPRSDPQRHNLRDLWVDVETYDLWKAHFAGRYAPTPKAPVSPTEVTVYFRNVLGCWVVSRALWTYDDPPVSYAYDVESDEIGLPDTLPDWLFDVAEYRARQLAGEPDYLGLLLERLRNGG